MKPIGLMWTIFISYTQYSVLYTMVFLWLPRELIKLNIYSSISHPKNLWVLIIKWTLVCQHKLRYILHIPWSVCFRMRNLLLQIFDHNPLKKFMKGKSACWEMTSEFQQFYSHPTYYRMYRYFAVYFMKVQRNV